MFFVLHNVPPIVCPTFGVHFIHAGFSAKDAGFFSFYAYLSKSNKRESISILTGFTFDSRLVCFIIMIDLLKNV